MTILWKVSQWMGAFVGGALLMEFTFLEIFPRYECILNWQGSLQPVLYLANRETKDN